MKSLIPDSLSLLQTIERAIQSAHIPRLHKSLGLLHVYFLIQLSIHKSMGYVHSVQMHVLNCCQCQDKPDSRSSTGGSKNLCVIQSRLLAISLGHKASLVSFNAPICLPLHFKHPSRSNGLPSRRQLHQFPSTIFQMHMVLFLTCLLPKMSIRTFYCLCI